MYTAYYPNRDAVRYAFGPLIQQELLQFASEWNNHRIRQSNMAEVPGGIPEVLCHMPHLHSKYDCILFTVSLFHTN